MPNNFMGITEEEAIGILYKRDVDGIAYSASNGYLNAKNANDEYQKAIENCKKAVEKVDKILEELRTHFNIEYS